MAPMQSKLFRFVADEYSVGRYFGTEYTVNVLLPNNLSSSDLSI